MKDKAILLTTFQFIFIFSFISILSLGAGCIIFQNKIIELETQNTELKTELDYANQEIRTCDQYNQQLQEQLSKEIPTKASSIIRQLEIDLYNSQEHNNKLRDEISTLERESRSEYRRLQQKYGN
jgi:septal ring factor EnvC (AmiA/AmiB activator)